MEAEQFPLSELGFDHLGIFLKKGWISNAEKLAKNLFEPERKRAIKRVADAYLKSNLFQEALALSTELNNSDRYEIIEEAVERYIDLGFCEYAFEAAKNLPEDRREKFSWLKDASAVQ